jgi:hypothetical protein
LFVVWLVCCGWVIFVFCVFLGLLFCWVFCFGFVAVAFCIACAVSILEEWKKGSWVPLAVDGDLEKIVANRGLEVVLQMVVLFWVQKLGYLVTLNWWQHFLQV